MRRGRSRNKSDENVSSINQLQWNQPYNFDQFVEPLSEEQIFAIDDAAMRVLEEIGIEFLKSISAEGSWLGCIHLPATDLHCSSIHRIFLFISLHLYSDPPFLKASFMFLISNGLLSANS